MFWGGFYLQIKQISSFNIRVKISNIFAKMFPRKGDKFYLYFPQMFYSWYYLTRREVWGEIILQNINPIRYVNIIVWIKSF